MSVAMLADRVSVAPVKEEQSASGFHIDLPEVLKPDGLSEGIVLSVGPGAQKDIAEGQRIVFPMLAAEPLDLEEEDRILILCADDIVAVRPT